MTGNFEGVSEQLGIFFLPVFVFGSKVSGHLLGQLLGHLSSSVAPLTPLGPRNTHTHTHTHTLAEQRTYFSVRTGQERIRTKTKDNNRETSTRKKIRHFDMRQNSREHEQNCARHKLVLLLVECRTHLQIYGGLFAAACSRARRGATLFPSSSPFQATRAVIKP